MMEPQFASYPLRGDSAIHHWLACGPITTPLTNLEAVIKPDGSPFGPGGRWAIANAPDSLDLKLRVYRQRPPTNWQPGARPARHQSGPFDHGQWDYAIAEEDNLIDFSLFNLTPAFMEAWLFACLRADVPLSLSAELLTIGPTRVWLNGMLYVHYVGFGYVEPTAIPLTLTLAPGLNDLQLHGEMIGWREARLALGLRFTERPPVQVCLPLGDVAAERWHRAEETLPRLSLRQFAFPTLPARLWLHPSAPEALDVEAEVTIPLPAGVPTVFQGELDAAPLSKAAALFTLTERARLSLAPGEAASLPITPALIEAFNHIPNEHDLRLTLRPADGTPYRITREVWIPKGDYRREPYGDYDSRRREALAYLAQLPYEVMGAIAAVETGKANSIEPAGVDIACEFMSRRCDCADFYALTLLALLERYGEHLALRPADRQRITDAFHRFKYWIDEPGIDAMCYFTENHQILFHVTAYLAGQRWPDVVFVNSGLTGRRQMDRARPRIERWILNRLRGGFSEWDSNAYLTLDAFALLALVEFAHSPRLRTLAETLLHKIFFIIACQSWRGAHASSHGRCYVSALKTARDENTSSPQRIAWGLGGFNGEMRATGLLALAHRYRVPDVVQRIGAHLPELLVTRARSAGRYRPRFDLRPDMWEVNTLTRRTPNYALSAAVDYRPGKPGIQEHLWQATLSPEAAVFTTHPGNSQEHGNARPNFWAGSARLPRVAMADATIVCLYNLALGGGLPFTHAYFPTAAFDEYALEGCWAFARVGNGYLALWGDGDLRLTETGRHAEQEIRSSGPGQAWLCRMGGADDDGDFVAFCRNTRAHAPQVDNLNVRWIAPHGRALEFGWEKPLLVDDRPQPLKDFPHYDNLYTRTPLGAETMVIRFDDDQLVLDLKRGAWQLIPAR